MIYVRKVWNDTRTVGVWIWWISGMRTLVVPVNPDRDPFVATQPKKESSLSNLRSHILFAPNYSRTRA